LVSIWFIEIYGALSPISMQSFTSQDTIADISKMYLA